MLLLSIKSDMLCSFENEFILKVDLFAIYLHFKGVATHAIHWILSLVHRCGMRCNAMNFLTDVGRSKYSWLLSSCQLCTPCNVQKIGRRSLDFCIAIVGELLLLLSFLSFDIRRLLSSDWESVILNSRRSQFHALLVSPLLFWCDPWRPVLVGVLCSPLFTLCECKVDM